MEQIEEPKKIRIWLIILTVILVMGAIGGIMDFFDGDDKQISTIARDNQQPDKQQPDKQEKQAEVPKLEKISTTAKEIVTAYKENEVAADAKYKGKLVTVSGIISNISNGMLDNSLIITVGTGEKYSFDSVYCNAKPSEKDKIITLKKGEKISVEGIGQSATIGSPSLKDCTVN